MVRILDSCATPFLVQVTRQISGCARFKSASVPGSRLPPAPRSVRGVRQVARAAVLRATGLTGGTRQFSTGPCSGWALARDLCRTRRTDHACISPLRVPAGALPLLACRGGVATRVFGFALCLFEALACALQLVFRDAYTLLGHLGLQSRPLERFRAVAAIHRRNCTVRCIVGGSFATRFFHAPVCEARRTGSLTYARAACHRTQAVC